MVAPSYLINTRTNSGEIDVYVQDVLASTYTFDDNIVTLSERLSSADLDPIELGDILLRINTWIKLIRRNLVTTVQPITEYVMESIKTATDVKMEVKIDNDLVTEATYVNSTNTITFAARDEITMNYEDFKRWVGHLVLLQESSAKF